MAVIINHSRSGVQRRTGCQNWQRWQRHTSLSQYPPLTFSALFPNTGRCAVHHVRVYQVTV